MGTSEHRHRHFAVAESNPKRHGAGGTTSTIAGQTICSRAMGGARAKSTHPKLRQNDSRAVELLRRLQLGTTWSRLVVISLVFIGCSRPDGSRSAEQLGAIRTSVNPSGEATDRDTTLESYSDKAAIISAIGALTEGKKLVSAQKLAYRAALSYPADEQFVVIHARTLLDLGRSKEAALMLSTIKDQETFESDIKFLTAITKLSTIQREQFKGEIALLAFINACQLLYEVSRKNPEYKDRFPPRTTVNDVRQTLTRYGDRLPLDQLNISLFTTPNSIAAIYSVLEKMQRSTIASSLLESASNRWPQDKSLLILKAKQHLTQNEPKKGLSYLNRVEPVVDLNTEQLLTYAAGQIAVSKQLDTPPTIRLVKSYHALLTAEKMNETSVFSSLIPKVKKTIIAMLPKKLVPPKQSELSPEESVSLQRLIDDAKVNKLSP